MLGLYNAISTSVNIPSDNLTITYGPNWGAITITGVYLIGNILRLGLTATRNTPTTAGDMANEVVATVIVNHGGKIKNLFTTTASGGATGPSASYAVVCENYASDSHKITINMASVGGAATNFSTYIEIPATIIPEAYV